MATQDRLKDYRARRDVRRSGEPAGRVTSGSGRTNDELDRDA
jgi:hypothetical protein